MLKKHHELLADGIDSYCFWGREGDTIDNHAERFATSLQCNIDGTLSRFDGRAGFHSKLATRTLIAKLTTIDPDVVHLHNLHGYYINVELLFGWLAQHRCQVKWTLHDCWAFTGHCTYFTYVNCAQWRTHCAHCPQKHEYPKSILLDSSRWNFDDKRRLFNLLPTNRMTLISPSHWLEDLVKQSFLAKYSVEVIPNAIDTSVFKPTPSGFRERYGLENRFIIMGAASTWSNRKGLSDFVLLADMLNEKFAIVLVGPNPKQLKGLPKQILGITRTESQRELAEIYTAADVFFCSSREENYPTVHLEAQACGTPVITYDAGGSSETLCLTKSVSLPVEDIKQACEQIKVLQNTTKGYLTLNTGANV